VLCGEILLEMALDFMKFHVSAAAGLKNGQFNRKRNFEKTNPASGKKTAGLIEKKTVPFRPSFI
jgi:hypothetical protein